MADNVTKITPQEARKRIQPGSGSLLVCAYDSKQLFEQNHLEGAISLDVFRSRAITIPRDREIIFYCA
jgi:hypothetical protein